jgi:serine/threonine-protein kinase
VSERLPPQIGRYVVDRVLGAGAMGQVYLGHDPQLDRAVAIKTIRAHGLPPEARELYMRRFQNEARAAARLHHPGIVAVYDVGEDPAAGPYLVLEFVAGSSLKQILQSRGPLDPKALVTLAEQAARALDTAHAAGIVHRDVKPDNLLLTPEGRAKLADFGIARLPDAQLTQEGQFLGTPCYAAPETLTAGEYGPRTDLFSFAATLYEAVSGARAFPGEDAVAVAHKVIHDSPPPPSEVARPGARIPRAVDEVLLRALSKDPRKRPGSAGELARELRAAFVGAGLLDPTGVHATDSHGDGAPSPAAEAGGGGGRGGLVAFAGLLLAGVAATVALLWVLRDPGVGEAADPDDAGAPRVDAAALTPRDAAEAEPTAAHDAGAPDLGAADAGADAGPDAGLDAGLDAGAPAAEPDLGAPPPTGLTQRQREDLAKDALDRARGRLADGDIRGARRALDEALARDPGVGGADDVTAQVEAAERARDGLPP